MTEQSLNDFGTALAALAQAPLIVAAVLGILVLLFYMIRHGL